MSLVHRSRWRKHALAGEGKLARVRRAAPRPARHPLGGSAHVLVRRGAVIPRGEVGARPPGRPKARAPSPRGIGSGTRETRGRHSTRGKLAAVRRAAPRPGRHPLGGSAQVLLRRGAVIPRGESWEPERRAAPSPATIPSGDRLAYSQDEGPSYPPVPPQSEVEAARRARLEEA